MESSDFLQDLLRAKGTVEVQLILLILQALLWYFIVPIVGKALKSYIDKKPYKKQFIELADKSLRAALKTEFDSLEKSYEYTCLVGGILVQHSLGGALCFPSAFGLDFVSSSVAGALARHGALMEAGWELQDGLDKFYQVFIKNDWSMNSSKSLRLIAFHHATGLSLVIPMNMFYGYNVLYHKGVFLMQGVSAWALFAQYYAFTLDLSKRFDLVQMKIISVGVFLAMFYGRIIGFICISLELIPILYSENLLLLSVAVAVSILMQSLNYNFILENYRKMVKYAKMPLPKNSLKKTDNFSGPTQVVRKLKKSISQMVLQEEVALSKKHQS
uniref:TLC domain-containing protein n=1 Tax=Aplanochytrium stocchinoi TaxID=215587 RepID=A0A7S3LKS8_9STRA|mmetsp:Transcript_8377/g.9860  ORF Transcript_8377/g.9860 Transcript_8377/m.9860 type:complete len:329 (+) Transcript_8377:144-1130(+)|eukprot:CAMPEP_0204834780 /NCGR_PEP_ID=MMETSP1346-20131115/20727_1 /ASSEMBLY_ACC=CAM_ASM_000771 /TAXON_ID=215587 /ORGANISM="Aplanochytrium stocchinoi, Strain GSBS06" /LENGTH=328 /DNA_ID=CAMNT_0051968285 /DNA_START=144 /DNA_END=1130 /DNA_ORIENTATION=-